MKKGIWIVLGVVLILGAAIWWLVSSSSSEAESAREEVTPDVEVVNVGVTDITGNTIDATVKLRLENPYPVDFTANRLDYEIYIDSIKVITDSYEEPVEVKSSDGTEVELPMKILASPMKRVMEYFEREAVDSAVYAIHTSVFLEVPVEGVEEFNMEMSKKMPTLQKPQIQLEDVETNLLDFGNDDMNIDIRITNPNEFPIEIEQGKFTLEIEGDMTLNGALPAHVNVPPGATEVINVHVNKEGSLTQTGLSMLFDQEDTQFNYHFSSVLNSENGMLNDSQMNMHVSGTLDELSDVMF